METGVYTKQVRIMNLFSMPLSLARRLKQGGGVRHGVNEYDRAVEPENAL